VSASGSRSHPTGHCNRAGHREPVRWGIGMAAAAAIWRAAQARKKSFLGVACNGAPVRYNSLRHWGRPDCRGVSPAAEFFLEPLSVPFDKTCSNRYTWRFADWVGSSQGVRLSGDGFHALEVRCVEFVPCQSDRGGRSCCGAVSRGCRKGVHCSLTIWLCVEKWHLAGESGWCIARCAGLIQRAHSKPEAVAGAIPQTVCGLEQSLLKERSALRGTSVPGVERSR
jgi:hypothetical protein